MSKFSYTDEQITAISDDGNRLLVSASAGSGKTAVLVERICKKILDENFPVDISEFLIVTFTKAAASSVIGKITSALYKRLASDPGNERIFDQIMRVSNAEISTINSFCLNLCKSYYNILGIAPDVRVMDESEAELLNDAALDRLLTELYEKGDAEFFDVVEFFCDKKSDVKLVELIKSLDNFMTSIPSPKDFFARQLEVFKTAAETSVFEGAYGEELKTTLLMYCDQIMHYCAEAKRLAATDGELSKVEEKFEELFGHFILVKDFIAREKYGDARQAFLQRPKKSLIFPKDYSDICLKEEIQNINSNEIKESIDTIAEYFMFSEEDIKDDFEKLFPIFKTLFDIELIYIERKWEAHYNAGALSFADCERKAYELLISKFDIESGTFEKSEIAKNISEKYNEILIDEYQDVNDLQDLIFRAISKDEKNLFMVGDLKQSIYRFRQADPKIFMDKRAESSSTGENGKKKIFLRSNFRCAPAIIDFVNYFFGLCMSKQAGETPYDTEEMLVSGREFSDYSPVEVNILSLPRKERQRGNAPAQEEEESEPAEEISAVQTEAEEVAKKIKELIDSGFKVTDSRSGEKRAVRARDIVILMRNLKNKAYIFTAALQKQGLFGYCEQGDAFFTKEEITVVRAFLNCIDNPLQDIELIGAMRSGMFGFKNEEIIEIRLCAKDCTFYEALTKSAKTNKKSADFLNTLGKFRVLSKNIPLSELILKIYEETLYPEKVGAMQNGSVRAANLQLLYDHAANFESTGASGVFEFNRYLEEIIEKGNDIKSARAFSEASDVVRIISIHKSKGLEFPVVFLCNCSGRFNKTDLNGTVLMNKEIGIASKIKDSEKMICYDSFPRKIIKRKMLREYISEELRCLYVALTRPKEKLIIYIRKEQDKNGELKLPTAFLQEGKIQLGKILNAGNFAEWILLALSRHASGYKLGIPSVESGKPVLADFPIDINIIEPFGETEESAAEERHEKPYYGSNAEKIIAEKLAYKYPNEAATKTAVKITATDLNEKETDAYDFVREPEFLKGEKANAAERGTLLHKILELIPIGATSSKDTAESAIKILVEKEFITDEEAKTVPINLLLEFGKSTLAKRIIAADEVYREQRFEVLLDENDFAAAGASYETHGEKVILQGVFDLVFLENGKYYIVDFKSDSTRHSEAEMAENYRIQLSLYKKAAEKIWGEKVANPILYWLTNSREIDIPSIK